MNVSGIRPSIGFYDSNSIEFRQDIGSTSIDNSEASASLELTSTSVKDDDIAQARKSQTFGAYDFASQYKPGESFELKGVDSDIKSLDVERAVSDMQKDSVIHRYQYFVQNKLSQNSDYSANKSTEDFSL